MMNPTRPLALLLSFAATLAAQEPLPLAYQQALTLARQHKAPVLAFVLPPAREPSKRQQVERTRKAERSVGMLVTRNGNDAPAMRLARDVVLRQVQMLRGAQGGEGRVFAPQATAAQAVFALTVPVFATAGSCGAEPGETVVLVGPDGKRVQGWVLDLLDREAFLRLVGGAVLADEQLAPRQANVPTTLREQLAQLRAARADADDPEAAATAQRLQQELAQNLVALAPLLVRRDEGELVIAPELWAFEVERAPLGSTAHQELGDPCPACGLGYTPPGLMTVLKLIGP